jgi:hypothetical protein
MEKNLFASKTIWVNALALAVTALTAVAGHDVVANNPQLALWIGAALAGANILLRLVTSAPIALK